jgi:hypothetical protein
MPAIESSDMAAIDNQALSSTAKFHIGKLPVFSLTGFIAAVAVLLTLVSIAATGLSETGIRVGSQMAWRFSFFVFLAALVAGPLYRVAPLCRFLGPHGRQLIWSFCAALGVYLASVLVPNLLRLPLPQAQGLDIGMLVFVVLCGLLAAITAYAASPEAARRLGEKAQRAILAIGLSYFWLTYAVSGLSHISGPHRPDLFYGLSVSLLVAALLVRFLDRFLAKWHGQESPT